MYEVAWGKENIFEAFVILQGHILDTEEDKQDKVPEKRKANHQKKISVYYEEERNELAKTKCHFYGSIMQGQVMSMLINIVLILCTGPGSSVRL